jgi:hypothetical protein
MLTKHLDVTYAIIWTLTISHIMAAVICLFASNVFARLSLIRVGLLVPAVVSVVYLGAFNANQSWGDIGSVMIFGAIGWIMKQFGWPRPPLILGFVLGATFERYFFISNELFGASLFLRPVVAVVLAAAAWIVFSPVLQAGRRWLTDNSGASRIIVAPRLSVDSLFTLLVVVAVIAAIALTQPWPDHAKLVPLAAAYAALVLSVMTFVAQTLFRLPSSGQDGEPAPQGGHVDAPALVLENEGVADATLYWRAFRFFAWIAVSFGVMAVCGMLPGLFLTMSMMTRLEFGEKSHVALLLAAGMTALFWLVFGHIFSMAWPPSLIGDAAPWLREITGLM